jgi:AAA domain
MTRPPKLRVVDPELEDMLGPEPVSTMTMDEMRARPPFKPWRFAEYERIPATPWLIGDDSRPVLIARGLWCTFGLFKSAKTYLSIEQAFCIAAGIEFNGLPTMQGRIAYICAEGDAKRIVARVVALCNKHDKDPGEILSPTRFNLIMSPVNLLQPDGPKGVGTLIKQLTDDLGPYQAIWLDTWAKMLAEFGGNDTDADSVMPAIMGCDRIRAKLGCSVVIVAHVGLNEKAKNRPKGLSDLPGAVDGGTLCEKEGEGRSATFTFSARMQRYAADEYSFQAKMEGNSAETTVLRFMNKQEAARAKLNPDQVKMLDILREFDEGASVDQWRDAVIAAKLWTITRGKNKGQQPSNPRQKWADELGKLERAGWVEIIGTMVELNDEPVKPAEPDAGEEFEGDEE